MSQYDVGAIPGTTSGNGLAAIVRGLAGAVESSHSGNSRPAYLPAGGEWLDTSAAGAWVLKLWTGTVDVPVLTFNPSTGVITSFNDRFLRYDAAQTLVGAALAQAQANLRAILGGWYEFDRKIGTTGTAWLWDLPTDAKEWRLTMRGARPASGTATLAIRCGSASAAADSGASDYYNQNYNLTNGTFASGAAQQSSPSPFFFAPGVAPKHVVAEGNIGSANDVWTLASTAMNYFSGSVVGHQFSFRQALGRKPRLFLASDIALVDGDLIMEVRN